VGLGTTLAFHLAGMFRCRLQEEDCYRSYIEVRLGRSRLQDRRSEWPLTRVGLDKPSSASVRCPVLSQSLDNWHDGEGYQLRSGTNSYLLRLRLSIHIRLKATMEADVHRSCISVSAEIPSTKYLPRTTDFYAPCMSAPYLDTYSPATVLLQRCPNLDGLIKKSDPLPPALVGP